MKLGHRKITGRIPDGLSTISLRFHKLAMLRTFKRFKALEEVEAMRTHKGKKEEDDRLTTLEEKKETYRRHVLDKPEYAFRQRERRERKDKERLPKRVYERMIDRLQECLHASKGTAREVFTTIKTNMADKDKREIAVVQAAVGVISFAVAMATEWYVFLPATAILFVIAAKYPSWLKKHKNKVAHLDKTQKAKELFANTEFKAGIPATPAYYLVAWAVSSNFTTNHVLTVAAAWLATRTVGFFAWGAVMRFEDSERYKTKGWGFGKISCAIKNGFFKRFSHKRGSVFEEIGELFGYTRRLDWYAALARPAVMAGVLALGLSGSNAFFWNAVISEILFESFYALYYSPKFYPEAEAILRNKKPA